MEVGFGGLVALGGVAQGDRETVSRVVQVTGAAPRPLLPPGIIGHPSCSCTVSAGAVCGWGRTLPTNATPHSPPSVRPSIRLTSPQPCDRGTLRDALGTGLLHRRLACGALAVDVDLLLGLLLDVAYALRHLHALELMHGDVRVRKRARGGGG